MSTTRERELERLKLIASLVENQKVIIERLNEIEKLLIEKNKTTPTRRGDEKSARSSR